MFKKIIINIILLATLEMVVNFDKLFEVRKFTDVTVVKHKKYILSKL